MAVKVKRKASKKEGEESTSESNLGSSLTEPPCKKQKCFTPDEFIRSLRGPNASEALKQWLYMISNQKEKAQMDKDSSAGSKGSKSNLDSVDQEINDLEKEKTEGKKDTDDYDDDELAHENDASMSTEENESVEHIDAFLNCGGSLADLTYTLPAPENAHVSHLRHVFRALSKVLLRISAEHQSKIPEAIDICRDLIGSFSKHIHDMLKIQRSIHERIINLELLTAMVALDARFAKEILHSVSLEADNVEQLTSMRISHHVRIAYLKFLVALLIDADNSLIMAVINKPWLLISIMDGLQYDPSDLVLLLLMTMKKSILENKSVPKSAKLIIFNTDSIISLLYLYKWKGPLNRPKSLTFWAMKKMADKPKLMAEVDSSEAELVSSAAQDLLIVLLTDHRFGIIFRDTSIAHHGDRQNKLVTRVLQKIGHPWENTKVAELVSKVLAACPDSLRSTLSSIEHFLEPRSSAQWFNCVKFVRQVLEDQCPEEVLCRQLSWLTMMQLSASAIEMCAPKTVLNGLISNSAAALYSEEIAVAKCTIDLLVHMLRKMNGFVEVVRRWASEGVLTYAQTTSFRRHVTETLLKHVPKLDSIQKSWLLWSEKYFGANQIEVSEEATDKPIDILSNLLELLELYNRLCPAALDPLHSAQSDLKLSMTTTVVKATGTEDVSQLRNRLYQLLLAMNDSDFNVENKEIREPMCLVFRDLIKPCLSVRRLAWSVLQSLIRRAGSLEGSPQEAVVWLSVFQETFTGKEDLSDIVVCMLVESMIRACTACPKYLDIIAHSEERAAELQNESGTSTVSLFDIGALQELFDDASESNDVQQSSSSLIQMNASTLSPWLPAFLEVLQENITERKIKRRQRQITEEFCNKLILRLMYRLPHPHTFLQLLSHSYSNIISAQLNNYVQSWLPGGSSEPVDSSLLDKDSLEVNVGTFIFFQDDEDSSPTKIQKLFVSLTLPILGDDVKDFSDVKRHEAKANVVQVVHFICFHLSQLALKGKLDENHAQKSEEMLSFISETAMYVDKEWGKMKNEGLFYECFSVFLSHPLLFQQFSPLSRHTTVSSNLLTNLITNLAKTASSCDALECYLAPYKDKFLKALKAALKTTLKKNKSPKGNPVALVDAFPLKFEEISDFLVLISSLPSSGLVTSDAQGLHLSQWCNVTIHLLSRAADLRAKGSSNKSDVLVLPATVVAQTSSWIVDLLTNDDCDLSLLIEAFTSYIETCPQQTSFIPDMLLSCLINTKHVTMANSRLATWIATCTPTKDLFHVLKVALKDRNTISQRLAVILPVVKVGLQKEKTDGFKKSCLISVFDLISEKVQNSVTSLACHPDWLAANIDVIVLLLKRFMKHDVRESLCKALEKKAPALTQEKLYYLKLITEVIHTHPAQLLLLLIAWLGNSLKKYGTSSDQRSLVHAICETIKDLLSEESDEDFSNVKNSKVWQETLRLVLKIGLAPEKEDDEGSRHDESHISCILLQTLSTLLNRVYSPKEGHEHIQMIHSMATQHSEFLNIMMSSSPSKFELVQVLHVLLKQSPGVMDSSHIPIILAAYNASLSKVDRELLRILVLYEQGGIDLSQYRPYFWGRQGANHYSIWSNSAKSPKSLWQQPRPDQVLGLLDTDMVKQTIGKFPINSSLKVTDDENGYLEGIYDPSFCLPLFMFLLSPESPILTHMFVKSGALALTLSSLSSFDVDIRAAAYTTLSRFISHLQMAKGRNKDLLLHFMSAFQKGVVAYGNDNPRLPSVVSVFLAHTAIEIANPSSSLYKPLINFILIKPAMNLRTVPELLPLLHSDHVEHMSHRHWILQVLTEGLRSTIDVMLSMEVVVFKLLPSFYSCCLSDLKSRLYILRCLRSAVGVPYGASYLVRDYALASWLHEATITLSTEDSNLVTEMTRILSALWKCLSNHTQKKQDLETGRSIPVIEKPASKLLRLLLALLPKLRAPVGLDVLEQYVSDLCEVTANLKSEDYASFSKDSLLSIIEVMSPHCPNKRQFLDLLDLGCNFVDSSKSSCFNATMPDKLTLGLRRLTILWIKSNTS